MSVGYTFFSAACGTFCKIDNIFGHKASLHKYKNDIISFVLTVPKRIKIKSK
jgi:hypothetical protein